MASRRKQEEKHLQTLKKIQQIECNKKCFECDQRGPTYVDVTIGSFVCTSCGGILRGLNPPHRVKSVSMATFSSTEIAFIETRGNEYCKNIYLGRYEDRCKAKPESRNDHPKLKAFMEQKYEQKRWYVPPEEAQKPLNNIEDAHKKANAIKPLTSLLGQNPTPIQVQAKTSVEKKRNTPVDNILGDLNSADGFQSFAPTKTAAETGFADFGNAFSSAAPSNAGFDAFGDFTSGQQSNSQAISGLGSVPVMNVTAASANAPQTTTTDKYADLADLFSSDQQSSTSSTDFGWSSFAAPASTTSNQFSQMGSIFGSPTTNQAVTSVPQGMPNTVYGNMPQQTQSQTAALGNNMISGFGVPQQSAFGGMQQPAYGAGTSMPNFGTAQPFGMTQSTMYGTAPQSTPMYGATPQSTPMYGNTAQTFMPQQTTGGFVGNVPKPQAAQNPSNPFMYSAGQSVQPAVSNLGNNPFMTQQAAGFGNQAQQNAFRTQSSVTNPFMASNSQPPQVSTNPFF